MNTNAADRTDGAKKGVREIRPGCFPKTSSACVGNSRRLVPLFPMPGMRVPGGWNSCSRPVGTLFPVWIFPHDLIRETSAKISLPKTVYLIINKLGLPRVSCNSVLQGLLRIDSGSK